MIDQFVIVLSFQPDPQFISLCSALHLERFRGADPARRISVFLDLKAPHRYTPIVAAGDRDCLFGPTKRRKPEDSDAPNKSMSAKAWRPLTKEA